MKPCAAIGNLCKLFSLIFSTFTVLYFIYIVLLVKIILHGDTFTSPLIKSAKSEDGACEGDLAKDIIVRLHRSRTCVIAGYLDLRGGRVVRIVGIAHRYEQETLFCSFCFPDANDTVVAELQVHSDHFEFPYGTTDIICNVKGNRVPRYVSINADKAPPTVLKVQNIQQETLPPKFEYNFLVCISALFGSYGNILQFVQSMEMYRMLGAEKVVLYHTDSSSTMKKVLRYYIEKNVLEVIPWPITSFLNVSTGWHYPEHPGELHYYGQTAALNDCIYRHMYRSKFILLNDIDELIVPALHQDWPEMMDFLQRSNVTADIFLFENHVFPTTLQDKRNSRTPTEWSSVPGLNIVHHVSREPNQPDEINPTKMIVNPRSVVSTSVHVALEFTGDQYQVPIDVARLCHYREPKQKDLAKEFLIEDTILAKVGSRMS
ncbi:beta-1,4-galactosyltransferase galt-1 isoform X2 [Xenopus laevis]|uniref:Glycosyltransferase family 92 protein n=1 Tax=Xenopus laevis TaxID=8355 RepID=A0A8J1LFD4_XENLA|nr:beta-1,4-galactosyltransferase galt-1 isoform X2 [Xenopus laevis]